MTEQEYQKSTGTLSVFEVLKSMDGSILMDALNGALELGKTLEDIPPQIEFLSRVTLLKSFIYRDSQGYAVDLEKFEKVWAYLTAEHAELEPNSLEKSGN